MHKIIPLVLFVSVSLIIGNQVAFAETDVWAFYGEEFGSAKDATNPGDGNVPPRSSLTGVDTDPSVFQIDKFFEEYQNVDNAATAAKSGPLLVARCFEGIPNPEDTFPNNPPNNPSDDDWVFGVGAAEPFQCVQNQRAAEDLGLGVRLPVTPAVGAAVQPLEVEVGQLVVIDLNAIIGTYENFMFRISSNSVGEKSWVAMSDKPPTETLIFPDDFTPIGPDDGFFPGCDTDEQPCPNNDAYISFDPQGERYLYYTQTTRERDNLLQQIKADKMELVGGHGGINDNTALLLSGSHLTASWMIPLIVSAIGIGVFVVTRK